MSQKDKTTQRKVVVAQPREAPPIEVTILADSIVKISDAVTALRRGRLTDRAILLLIHGACKTDGRGKKVGMGEVRNVLDAMEDLKRLYTRQSMSR